MQIDDVDSYGPSHVVMTGAIEKMINSIRLIFLYLKQDQFEKKKKDSTPHLLIGIIIYYIAKLNKIFSN